MDSIQRTYNVGKLVRSTLNFFRADLDARVQFLALGALSFSLRVLKLSEILALFTKKSSDCYFTFKICSIREKIAEIVTKPLFGSVYESDKIYTDRVEAVVEAREEDLVLDGGEEHGEQRLRRGGGGRRQRERRAQPGQLK